MIYIYTYNISICFQSFSSLPNLDLIFRNSKNAADFNYTVRGDNHITMHVGQKNFFFEIFEKFKNSSLIILVNLEDYYIQYLKPQLEEML